MKTYIFMGLYILTFISPVMASSTFGSSPERMNRNAGRVLDAIRERRHPQPVYTGDLRGGQSGATQQADQLGNGFFAFVAIFSGLIAHIILHNIYYKHADQGNLLPNPFLHRHTEMSGQNR